MKFGKSLPFVMAVEMLLEGEKVEGDKLGIPKTSRDQGDYEWSRCLGFEPRYDLRCLLYR